MTSTIFKYEQIVVEPENVIIQAGKFLELETQCKDKNGIIDKEKRSYFVAPRYGNLHENIGKRSIISRIDAWKESLCPSEVYAFESIAGEKLRQEGYKLTYPVKEFNNPLKMLITKLRFCLR